MEPAPGAPLTNVVRIAIRNNVNTFFFQADVPFSIGFKATGRLSKDEYITLWKAVTEEHFSDLLGAGDAAAIQKKLEARNLIYMATRKVQNQVRMCRS
jgi:hypothetical protein